MSEEKTYDLRLSQARALSGQLGLFAEENEIPKICGIGLSLKFIIIMMLI